MPLLSRIIFGLVDWAARRGLADAAPTESVTEAKQQARRTGVRGETYAYWYLRRQGYVLVARNYQAAGVKGEIDMVGYDGKVLAFVEVKTRGADPLGLPEDALTAGKRYALGRIARQFLTERRLDRAPWRFDVLAIESRPGQRPQVRLHKGAFS